MQYINNRRLISFILLLLVFLPQTVSGIEIIKVGITEADPFAMQDSTGKWKGITVELWENIAKDLDIQYEYVELPLLENIKAVSEGRVALSVGALSITKAREQILDFTHPYYTSGLGIVSKKPKSSMFTHISNLIKPLGILIIFIAIGGILILFFESGNENPDFKKSNINNGLWWSIVTITTTGYGDLVPKTKLGRLFASVWMISGALAMPALISSLLVTDTLSQQHTIYNKDNLQHYKIGVIENTSTEVYFVDNNIPYVKLSNIEEMFTLIETNKIDAGVHDKPILQYKARVHKELKISSDIFNTQYYGIALVANSNMRELLNNQILEETTKRQWNYILGHYLNN